MHEAHARMLCLVASLAATSEKRAWVRAVGPCQARHVRTIQALCDQSVRSSWISYQPFVLWFFVQYIPFLARPPFLAYTPQTKHKLACGDWAIIPDTRDVIE